MAAEIPEVLDKQLSGTILTHLQLVAARVDAAEHAWKPADEKIPLRIVPPRLFARQRAARKLPEVLRMTKRIVSERLGLYGIKLIGRHRGSFIGLGGRASNMTNGSSTHCAVCFVLPSRWA
jgi:hypothetical protein